jgi:sulfur-carrier protein adenylyltransferase/sulfurtransferase
MANEKIELTNEELARYSRHLLLPGFGPEAQLKLKSARVLVIGAGGLGSPLLLYLAAAGVGTIGIIDGDKVDESNLQRQVLFGVQDKGQPKVEAALKKLAALNPHCKINVYNTQLTSANAMEIIRNYDVLADGSDNFPTRYLVNDACVLLDKPDVYASVFRFEGQVSVFNYVDATGARGPNYRDLYPVPPPPGSVPDCAEGGVLGVLPGIIGSLQAAEVIKLITGIGETLSGRLFNFDALSFESNIFTITRSPDNPLNGSHPTITALIDYEQFCGMHTKKPVREVTPMELKQWQTDKASLQLIDVREPEEYRIVHIGGELMPLKTILSNADKIDRNKKVVLHCKTGSRSAQAILALEKQFGFTNLYHLKGGILAYIDEVQPGRNRY